MRQYLSNPRLVILLLVVIISIGGVSYATLARTLNPQVKIPIVIVQTILPGGGPKDIEQLVTVPLEDGIQNVEKIKTVQSASSESISLITIEFQSGVDPEKARTDISSAVDSVSLPNDAKSPNVIKLDFENQPFWIFALTSKRDDASLFTFAQKLKKDLSDLSEVNRVAIGGIEETEIHVTIKPETFASYNVNPFTVTQLIETSLKRFPAGSVKTDGSTFALTVDPSIVTVDDIRNLKLAFGSAQVSLSDIAVISEQPKSDQNESYLAKKDSPTSRSVTFSIFKTATTNIDKAQESSKKLVEREVSEHSNLFEVNSLLNTADEINKQYRELIRDFIITISLVVLILFIFLGARQAIVSALSAPLSFLVTFGVMKVTGLTLNFLSLFSLILSLGLLVDDTVVIISAMSSYYRKGRMTPLETGLSVLRDFFTPVFTTTVTTVWAFLPLLLATGIIGEFIKSMPIVVSTALSASFLISIFITLPLIVFLLKPSIPLRVKILLRFLSIALFALLFFFFVPKAGGVFTVVLVVSFAAFVLIIFLVRGIFLEKVIASFSGARKILSDGFISFEPISARYQNIIDRILASSYNRRRAILMVVVFSIFSFVLLPLGFVKNEFFPKQDTDFLYVSLELPAGTSPIRAKEAARMLLDRLKKENEARFVSADVGRSFSSQQGIVGTGTNEILFTLVLTKREDRKIKSFDIAQKLREELSSYKEGKVGVQELSGGPPAGADVVIKVLGEDLTVLDTYANKIVSYLTNEAGVANVSKSIKENTSKLTFVPDKSALLANGVTIDQIGFWLRLFASGFEIDKNTFPSENEEKGITLRLSETSAFANEIGTINIPTPNGSVPLVLLGKLTLSPNPTLITREEGKRTISVSAAVTKGFNIQEINQKLGNFADSKLSLPQGYTWKTGGMNEENQRSVTSILQAMLLSFLLIITTMVVQFGSFRRAIIVILVIPLSISGVFIIFALSNTPLSFPALIGILALFGIVVKNAILLVDKIVKNEKKGMEFAKAISDAAASRLEPIALTSFCTIAGLIPITLSDPLWRGLGGAIIAGLTFSGTIMLFFIPVVYYLLFAGEGKGIKERR